MSEHWEAFQALWPIIAVAALISVGAFYAALDQTPPAEIPKRDTDEHTQQPPKAA